MKFNLVQTVSATLFFLSAVLSSPVSLDISPSNLLDIVPLDKRQCDIRGMTVSSCNSCFSTGDGPVQCQDRPYIHFGDTAGRSCDDQQAPFNDDFCSTYGTIPTPFGNGNWVAASGCGTTGEAGAHVGDISTGGDWTCNCIRDNRSTRMYCGIEFACGQYYYCACAKC